MGKSPIHTVDEETIERIKEIIQAAVDQTELINAYWVQSMAQARLLNQAAVGIKTLVDLDDYDGLIQGTGHLVTWVDTYHQSTAEPLRTYLENFKDAFDADFELKAKFEAMTIH
jgi:hypothetical protein